MIIVISSEIFLDPTFWQALGKARLWWKQNEPMPPKGSERIAPEWYDHWHRFIDHLADGGNAEEFFASLA